MKEPSIHLTPPALVSYFYDGLLSPITHSSNLVTWAPFSWLDEAIHPRDSTSLSQESGLRRHRCLLHLRSIPPMGLLPAHASLYHCHFDANTPRDVRPTVVRRQQDLLLCHALGPGSPPPTTTHGLFVLPLGDAPSPRIRPASFPRSVWTSQRTKWKIRRNRARRSDVLVGDHQVHE